MGGEFVWATVAMDAEIHMAAEDAVDTEITSR